MKYAYADLGPQQKGNEVTVNMRGGARNVMLLDVANFLRYRTGRAFRFTGGRYRGSPTHLEVPHDDHWYAVVDLGSYNARARATVKVVDPRAEESEREPQQALTEA